MASRLSNNVYHEELEFPCLAIRGGGISTFPWKTIASTALALRKGYFDGLTLVDCTGSEFAVISAAKQRGLGRFRGWNLFLNQRIAVRLEVEPTGKRYSVDELRQRVLKDFKRWDGWAARDRFGELTKMVERATSCAEILRALTMNELPDSTSA